MPYIKKGRREDLDHLFFDVVDEIDKVGEFNYIISTIASELVKRRGRSYAVLSGIRAEIQDAGDEFYRRVMTPYENSKMQANGDVFDSE
jgi:hypothetical protein